MMWLKKCLKKSSEKSFDQVLSKYIGSGFVKQADFSEMYKEWPSQQLEELSDALIKALQFLETQKELSRAYHLDDAATLQYLLENKREGNLSYLRKGEEWLIGLKLGERKH